MTTLEQAADLSRMPSVVTTDLPLAEQRRGKVRDIYAIPAESGAPPRLCIVATDRVSAFDVVLPTPIPGKGRILTDISVRWFKMVEKLGIIDHHLLSVDAADVPGLSDADAAQISGRVMVGRRTEVIPVECVVRGYVAGSGWVEYEQSRSICGVSLPDGLEQCGQLSEPIFTPATKAEEGHDENIDFDTAAGIAGREVMEKLRDASLAIYEAAAKHAKARGIILADTKFEFGYALDEHGSRTDEILLIDEILTPDSSRFWPRDGYRAGREQESLDKQYVRNFLLGLVEAGKWDRHPPGPALPDDVVRNTMSRYDEARRRLFATE